MSGGATIPIVVGLAVGIAMVAIFGIAMNRSASTSTVIPESNHLNLEIVGLNDSYHVGEAINFTFTVSGYGSYCQSPNAGIWRTQQFMKEVPVWASGLPHILCANTGENATKPAYHQIADTYDFSASHEYTVTFKPGNYTAGVRFEDQRVMEQNFTIVP